jgi:hypothetical protein
MENARCRNHANYNGYGIGSFNLGMVYANSKWYAKIWGAWGAWGMLAWEMQSARIMPTFQTTWIIPNSWHGKCREQILCQDLLWIGKPPNIGMGLATEVFPILAWYVLPAIAVPEKKFY